MKVLMKHIDNDFELIKKMIEDNRVNILHIVSTGLGAVIIYYTKSESSEVKR